MGLTEGHWYEDEEELTERQLENWIADNKAAYKKGLSDGEPKWISVNDRLPNDIIACQSSDDPDTIQYEIPNGIHEYLVTDGKCCAVGHWRPDAKAWDSFSFGWIEKDSTEDGVIGIGKVTHWMPLPDRP